MLFEKGFYELILNDNYFKAIFEDRIYFEETPTNPAIPYAVLTSIHPGSTREVNIFKPSMQLDIYHNNQFTPLEIGESIIDILINIKGNFSSIFISNIRAEKRRVYRVDKNLWKVPLDINFNVGG